MFQYRQTKTRFAETVSCIKHVTLVFVIENERILYSFRIPTISRNTMIRFLGYSLLEASNILTKARLSS